MMPLTVPQLDPRGLEHQIIRTRLPKSENYRTYYGREVSPKRIETAIRMANIGLMVPLCDLESEAIGLDPHLLGVCAKRFGALQTVGWQLDMPTGPDVDQKEAKLILEVIRAKVNGIPSFTERIYDLAWGVFDGRAALELHWGLERGTKYPWTIHDLCWLHPRRLSFDQARKLLIVDTFQSRGDFEAEGIPIEDIPGKFIWWKPRLFREYQEREGLGPRVMYWAFFKRFSMRMRMILTELFAVPWRIVTTAKDAPVQASSLTAAKTEAEALGRETTAMFDKGIELEVVSPGEHSGELMKMTVEDVDKQISKLVLGNTGTTEGGETNRANAVIQKDEQEIILTRDAESISARIQQQIIAPMVAQNFGVDALVNAPQFRIVTDPPRDREKDLGAAKTMIDLGAPLALDELYEVSGFRKPEKNEAVVVKSGEGAGVDAFGNPLPPTVKIVDPANPEPAVDADDAASSSGGLEEDGIGKARDNAAEDLELEREQVRHAIEISDNHGHDFMGEISGEATYSIQGGAKHDHGIQITTGHLEALAKGVPVVIQSTPGDDGHMHDVTIQAISAFDAAGVRELLRVGGVELAEDAIEYLASMPPETRGAVVATLIADAYQGDS